MNGLTDEKKQKWIKRWEQDNENVREGWIKRSDGWVGYVYLQNTDYVIRGDFLPKKGVYRRIWVPWYRRFQIYDLQYGSDLETVMQAVEAYVREAEKLQPDELEQPNAESI